MTTDNIPAPEAIKGQLDRILKNSGFSASDKQRKFLSFIILETLNGRSAQLKGYTIAVDVYGRTEKFDPQVDPIVRVEAGRLRRALNNYYLTAGKNDPVRIDIPKGAYVPTFHMVQAQPTGSEMLSPELDNSDPSAGPSIAVMPLVNLTGSKGQEYFADGLTEELTTELARYQDFHVIASQSTMRFKGREIEPKEVGRDLGVRFLLTGSFRKNLKYFKVTIRLLDTTTAEQIWGESYKRGDTPAELIAVQEDIAQRVVGVIADHFGIITRRLSRESRKKAPAHPKVYDAVLRFYNFETELTPAAFNTALTALEQAIEIDPEYGLAWSMIGHLYADNYALGFSEIETPLEKALTFAQRGIALAPESQFAQDALTLVYFHRSEKDLFLQHVKQTIALNPNSPYIVGVAGWHMMLYGEWEQGLTLLQKGMKLNPHHPSWFHLATFMDHYRRGEYENAFGEALKFNYPELFFDPLFRAVALEQMGRENEAKTAVEELLKLEPDFATRGRWMISRYVKVDHLVDTVIEGLRKAGLSDIE